MKFFWKVLIGVLMAIYPPVVYFGLNYFEPKYFAIILLLILVVRWFVSQDNMATNNKITSSAFLLTLGLILFAFFYNSITALKFYPVLMSLSLFLVFTTSLFFPPSVVERLARLKKTDLPESGIIYTGNVTKIWCCFFILNAAVAFYTAVFASVEIWTLYNGLISYLLMGTLFVGEWLYRTCFLKIDS